MDLEIGKKYSPAEYSKRSGKLNCHISKLKRDLDIEEFVGGWLVIHTENNEKILNRKSGRPKLKG